MLPRFSHRRATHDISASRIDPVPPKALTGIFSSNDDANWWMITLSDLTLLLLGFLVSWYVIDRKEIVRQQPPALSAGMAQEPKTAVAANRSLIPDEWQVFREEMQRFVGEIGLDEEVSIESAPNEMMISLKDTVPFDSGKADLRQQAIPVLEKVVTMILNLPDLSLEVSGHTDDLPISTSKFPSNWKLSAARASRVARYVIENGVDPSRISVRGYVNQRPRLPNSSVNNRSSNRRVEIRLYRGSDQNPIP
jgi:chemotaxis protein MotB